MPTVISPHFISIRVRPNRQKAAKSQDRFGIYLQCAPASDQPSSAQTSEHWNAPLQRKSQALVENVTIKRVHGCIFHKGNGSQPQTESLSHICKYGLSLLQ